jgi:predicted RNA polymerase sigma factor
VPLRSGSLRSNTRARRNAIVDRDRLANYPFYFAGLGEFEFRNRRYDISQEQLRRALALARNPVETEFLQKRNRACEQADALTSPVSVNKRG